MSEVIRRLSSPRGDDDFDFMFYCPGCRCHHSFRVRGLMPRYTFNGDMVKPTIEPDLLFDWKIGRCHATVRDGEITFRDDSTHALAGKTLSLEPFK